MRPWSGLMGRLREERRVAMGGRGLRGVRGSMSGKGREEGWRRKWGKTGLERGPWAEDRQTG